MDGADLSLGGGIVRRSQHQLGRGITSRPPKKVAAPTEVLTKALDDIRIILTTLDVSGAVEIAHPREIAERQAMREVWAEQDLFDHLWRHSFGCAGNGAGGFEDQKKSILRELSAIRHPITLEDFSSSLIRHLPSEVLLGIFSAVKFMADNVLARQPVAGMRQYEETRRTSIHCLGHGARPVFPRVCARWKHIACDHPVLWSSFSFPIFRRGIAYVLESVELSRDHRRDRRQAV